jgi:radical SAM protein with 4Fe4S-binding SPASM domain
MTPKEKFFLFNQSRHFCSVPWNHLKVDTDGTITTCTIGSQVLGNIINNSVSDILHNDNLIGIKKNLRNDMPDKNCASCHLLENTEDYSYKFLRDLYNPMFVKSTVDYDKPDSFVLNGVDLHWSSTCNLKCITCWAHQSSSIAKEMGLPIKHTPAESAEKLIEFIVNNQHSLKEIYMSGGEPTLIKHNLNLLKRLRRDLNFTIRINTNLSFVGNNLVIEELKNFPRVLFTISADTSDENKFNYIRRGANWNVFLKNLEDLKKMHFSWRLNSVFFVASGLNLPDTQEYFMNNFGIDDFTINQVGMGHNELRCRNLSDLVKQHTLTKLTAHKEKYRTITNLVGQLTNCIKELQTPIEETYENFFNAIDAKAGTNWRKIFPELE